MAMPGLLHPCMPASVLRITWHTVASVRVLSVVICGRLDMAP